LDQFHNCLMRDKTRLIMIALKPVISTLGGCFPRARTEPPREGRSAGSQRHRFPVGQGELRQRYIARRKLSFIFKESPPAVPIT